MLTRQYFLLSNRVLEYFVVFAILILISVVSFILLTNTVSETRDSRRLGDIAALRTALELYHTEHGIYPDTGWVNSADGSWSELHKKLRPYLPTMPVDPINETNGRVERTGSFNYSYFSTRRQDSDSDYVLVFRLEIPERAAQHQYADVGLVTSRGMVTFYELTGQHGLYAVSAP